MDYTKDLHELCETISDAIAEANDKIRGAGGKLSAGDVDYVDKLTHALKSIKTTMAMEGYSGDDGRSYDGRNYEGRSYEGRGRYSNRYSRDYSRHGGMVEELRELMQNAPDERTKQEFRRIIGKLETM